MAFCWKINTSALFLSVQLTSVSHQFRPSSSSKTSAHKPFRTRNSRPTSYEQSSSMLVPQTFHKVVRLGINPMIQPEPEDLPKDNPKLEIAVLSLDEGLYALACEEDVRCLATLVRSFKLIEVYIEHGVTALDSYLRAPRFRATIEDISDGSGSIAANRNEKILLLTWHESSEPSKKPVCDFAPPNSLSQHDSTTPCKDYVFESITPSHDLPTLQSQFSDINLSFVSQQATASHVIDDVMRQLSFEETKLDGEVGFADFAGSGVESSGLSHDVGRTQEPIVAEVSTQKPIVAEFFYDDEGIDIAYETEYDVQSSEDVGTDNDDDKDEDFLVDEENEIVEPDVDAHLFGISIELPFENIGVTNIVLDDVLEREDVDVINADGFDNDPSNDDETNDYRRSRLGELMREMEDFINDSGQWKRNLRLYKNNKVRIRTRCNEKVLVFTMSQGTGPTGPNHGMEAGPNGSSGLTTKSKKRKNTGTNHDIQACSSILNAHDKRDLCPWVLEIKHCTYKFLSGKIFDQVRVNPDIPVKTVQDQLQRDLEIQISMSKTFRAKAEKEIRGDNVLQYSMLRDYVVEL
ncbi:hypothetical protein Tco_0841000 [Tanacetum coccineum]|uniref:Uncharacterized protein n=1 Tax=Tanacetum coccineum TaxID=301880 RepID=A0ABQ5AYP4_9ASTR